MVNTLLSLNENTKIANCAERCEKLHRSNGLAARKQILPDFLEKSHENGEIRMSHIEILWYSGEKEAALTQVQKSLQLEAKQPKLLRFIFNALSGEDLSVVKWSFINFLCSLAVLNGLERGYVNQLLSRRLCLSLEDIANIIEESKTEYSNSIRGLQSVVRDVKEGFIVTKNHELKKNTVKHNINKFKTHKIRYFKKLSRNHCISKNTHDLVAKFPSHYSENYKTIGNELKNRMFHENNSSRVKEVLRDCQFNDTNLEKLPKLADFGFMKINNSCTHVDELIPQYSDYYKTKTNKLKIKKHLNRNNPRVEEALQKIYFEDSNLEKLPKIFDDMSKTNSTISTDTYFDGANLGYVIRKQENELIPRYSQSYKTRGNRMKNKIFRKDNNHNVEEALQRFHFNDSNLEKLPKIFDDISAFNSSNSLETYLGNENEQNIPILEDVNFNKLIQVNSFRTYLDDADLGGNKHNVEETLQHFHFDDSNLENLPKILDDVSAYNSTNSLENIPILEDVNFNELIPVNSVRTYLDDANLGGNKHNVEETLQHFHFDDSNLENLPKILDDVSAFNSTNSLETYLGNENEQNIPILEDVNFNKLIPVNSFRTYLDDADLGGNKHNVEETLQHFHFDDSNLENLPKILDDVSAYNSTNSLENIPILEDVNFNELIPVNSVRTYLDDANLGGNKHNVEETLQHFHFVDSNLENLLKIFDDVSAFNSTNSLETFLGNENEKNIPILEDVNFNKLILANSLQTYRNDADLIGNKHNVEEALQHFHFNDSNLEKLPKIFDDVSAFNSTNSLKTYLGNENEKNIPILEDVNFNKLILANSFQTYRNDANLIGNKHNVEEALQYFNFNNSNLEKLPKIFDYVSAFNSLNSLETYLGNENEQNILILEDVNFNELIAVNSFRTYHDDDLDGNHHNVEEALQHSHFDDSNLEKLPKIFDYTSAFNSTNSLEMYLGNENKKNIPIFEDVNFNRVFLVNSFRTYHDDADLGYNTGNESLDFVDSFKFTLNDRKLSIFTNVTRTTFRSVILSFQKSDFKYYCNIKIPLSNVTQSSPTDNSLALATRFDNNYNLREKVLQLMYSYDGCFLLCCNKN